MDYPFLTLDQIYWFYHYAVLEGVSQVARSSRGFLPAYVQARGSPKKLSAAWRRKRENFIKRHMAQVINRDEPLWDGDRPSRRHIALIMWAYTPDPEGVRAYISLRIASEA